MTDTTQDALALLRQIKDLCAGDALPNWENTPRTGETRGIILDMIDALLAKGAPPPTMGDCAKCKAIEAAYKIGKESGLPAAPPSPDWIRNALPPDAAPPAIPVAPEPVAYLVEWEGWSFPDDKEPPPRISVLTKDRNDFQHVDAVKTWTPLVAASPAAPAVPEPVPVAWRNRVPLSIMGGESHAFRWESPKGLPDEANWEPLYVAPAVPEGFWLAPMEPNEKMKDAGDDLMTDDLECAHNIWNAMRDAYIKDQSK